MGRGGGGGVPRGTLKSWVDTVPLSFLHYKMGPLKPISWGKWKFQKYASKVPTGEAGRCLINVS